MGDNIQKRIDIAIGTSYSGAGVKLAASDIAKLREAASLPIVGPLTRGQALTEQRAVDREIVDRLVQQRVRRMEEAARTARLRETVEETLFGRPEELQKAAKARFGLEEQAIRDLMARRIRVMRDEARKANLEEEVNRRLFGGDPNKAGGGGLLAMFNKFGTSSGIDPIIEKIAKLAPMFATAAAITKVAGLTLEGGNLFADISRHNAQNNLERQVADERKYEDFLMNFPILSQLGITNLGRGIADNKYLGKIPAFVRYGVGLEDSTNSRYENREAIEQLEDATKAQDQHTEAMKRRLAVQEQLREASKAAVDTLYGTLLKHNATAERAAVIDAQESVRILRRTMDEMGGKGLKPSAEMREELVLRQQAVNNALEDEQRAHARNMAKLESEEVQARLRIAGQGREAEREALRQSLDDQVRDVKDAAERAARERANIARLAAFDKETAEQRRKHLGDLEAQTRDTRLRTAGFGFTADLEQLRREAGESVLNDADPESRRLKVLKFFADDAAIRRQYHRETEDAERAHAQALLDTDADLAERRLRLAGKGAEAEKLELERQHADRLAEIRAQAEEELRAHAERAPDILRRVREDVDRADEQYQLGRDELDARNRALFRPDPLGAFSGESRLLTGVAGAAGGGGGVENHLRVTAEAARKAEAVRQRMHDNLQAIADWIRAQPAAATGQPVLH